MSLTNRTIYFYIISLLLAIGASIVVVVITFEVYCRINHEKFYAYGWETDNKTQDLINKCEARYGVEKVSIVLGDSFVEFYGDKESNLVKQLSINDVHHNYCNFGISGVGPVVYKNRLDAILNSKKLNIDRVIVFLYEGNDFSDFLKKEQVDTGLNDRRHSWLMSFVKNSYALNFIYRELIKKYIIFKNIDPYELIHSVNLRDLDERKSLEIFSKTPKDLIKKFEANLLNVYLYSVALSMPNYFERIHSPVDAEFEIQKDISLRPINEMINVTKNYGANLKFFIIPHDYFLFNSAKQRWSEIFRFEKNNNLNEQTKLTKYLLNNSDNFFYPTDIFNSEDYILDDGHLTSSGNSKLAFFCINRMNHN